MNYEYTCPHCHVEIEGCTTGTIDIETIIDCPKCGSYNVVEYLFPVTLQLGETGKFKTPSQFQEIENWKKEALEKLSQVVKE